MLGVSSTVVTVTFKNNKTKKSVSKKYRAYIKAEQKPVEEVKVQTLTSAKQTKAFEVQATMALAATGTAVVAASDFVLTRDVDKVIIAINKVEVDAKDATKVNITATTSLTDGNDYTLTYKGDAVASFKATDGVITTFDVTPATVVEGKETELKATKYAGDVIMSEGKLADSGLIIDETTFSNGGYLTDGKLLLNNDKDSVKIKVSHDTGKFDAGAKVYITNTYEIKAVASTATISQYKFSAEKSAPDWNTLKTARTTVAKYDGDDGYKLFFQIKDSDDKDITATCDYTVESADNTIVLVNQDTAIDNDGVSFTTVNTGKTSLIIKDTTGKPVANLPITVGATRVLNKVTLSKSSVYVSTGDGTPTDKDVCNEDITLTAFDQYGDKLEANVKVGNVTSSSSSAVNVTMADPASVNADTTYTLKVNAASNNDKGQVDLQFPIKVSYTNKESKTTEKTVKVSVRSMVLKGSNTFGVVSYHSNSAISGLTSMGTKTDKVDITVSKWSNDTHNIALPAVWFNNNAARNVYQNFDSTATCGAIVLKNLSTNKVYINSGAALKTDSLYCASTTLKSAFDTAYGSGTLQDQGLVLAATSTGVSKDLPAGTYQISYDFYDTDGKKRTVSGKFNIVDTQAKVEIVVKNASSDDNNINNVLADDSKVAVYYGGSLLAKDKYTITAGNVRTNNTNIYVKDANVTVNIPGTDKSVIVNGVSVGRTFTTSTAGWSTPSNY